MHTLEPILRNKKLVARIFLTILVVSAFAYYFFSNRDSFAVLKTVSIVALISIGLIELLIIATNALYLKISLNIYERNGRWKDLFFATFKSSVINFFAFFQAGIGYRAYFMKKNYKISYKGFTSILVMNYWALMMVSCLFGIVGLLLQEQSLVSKDLIVPSLLLSTTLILMILLVALPGTLAKITSYFKVSKLQSYIHQFQSHRTYWPSFIKIATAQYILSFLITVVLLKSIGADPTLEGVLVYAAVAQFSIFIALTPSAIGIKEGLLIATQDAMSVSTEQIVVAATLERVVYFVILIILGAAMHFTEKLSTKT